MRKLIGLIGLAAAMLCGPAVASAAAADAEVSYLITNGGVDTKGNGEVHFYPAGHHDGAVVDWARSGGAAHMPAGSYDVHVTFADGSARKDMWLDNQSVSGKVQKTVEIGLPIAEVRYLITNGGVDTKGNGQVHFYPAGHHEGAVVDWASSGGAVRMPAGSYDVNVTFADGEARKDLWLDNQSFSGKVQKTVEINLPIAEVTYLITNGGVDTKGNGEVHFYPAGHHDGSVVDWARSGGAVRLPAGSYDVHVTFSDGSATKDMWLDNQSFSGKVQKTVEIGLSVAEVSYLITNGGVDTKGNGEVHFYPAGHHDGAVVDWARSGSAAHMPAGSYDVHVTFADGAARKDIWLDNQSFSGNVRKTVEIGLSVAEVSYLITNGGVDTKDNGQVHFYPAGHHDGSVVDWARSGGSVRIPAAAYDVEVTFRDGMIAKQIWLDNLSFSGRVQRTVELNIIVTEPVVAVTQNGADVGDKATIDYFDPTGINDLGNVKSGQPALLEQGTYEIRATLADAEGWLHKAALSGKPHLTIAVQKAKTQMLTLGGPPPKACTIEVYGVNFDFNKAVLRPDSAPMLRQVLALFTGTPSFSAEVSGHTDNVGTPAYNLKLSDARAAAVKAWLVQQGVAATRVTSRGYGDTRPLVPNTTDANRFKNRRVELRRANCR